LGNVAIQLGVSAWRCALLAWAHSAAPGDQEDRRRGSATTRRENARSRPTPVPGVRTPRGRSAHSAGPRRATQDGVTPARIDASGGTQREALGMMGSG